MLCYDFRRGESSDFFVVKRPGPRQQPRSDKVRSAVVELRKRDYSIYGTSRELNEQGKSLGPTAVRQNLAAAPVRSRCQVNFGPWKSRLVTTDLAIVPHGRGLLDSPLSRGMTG